MTGQEFVKKIGKFGCAMFLIVLVGFLAICFFVGSKSPLKDYQPPEDVQYYAENPEELAQEINDNIAPTLTGIRQCYCEDGKVVVIIDEGDYFTVRSALLDYFDEELLDLRKDTGNE